MSAGAGPEFLLDVVRGAPEGFSLGLPDAHFVTLCRCPERPANLGPPEQTKRGEDRTAQEPKTEAM